MAHAFSLLIQEEKQREFRPNSQLNLESTSLHVNAPNLQNQNPLGARNFKTHYTANNNNMGHPLYDYCKSPGHTREKCYKLHAHLQSNSYNNQSSNSLNNQPYNQGNNPNHNQSHRFNRRKGSVANVHRTPTDMVHDNGNEQRMHDENQNVNMTKEQYGQIMNLLQHFQVGNIGGSSNNDNVTNGSFSFAGPFSEEISVSFPDYVDDNGQHSFMGTPSTAQNPASIISPGTQHYPQPFATGDTFSPHTPSSTSSCGSNRQTPPAPVQSEAPVLRKYNKSHQTHVYLKYYVYRLPSNSQLHTSSHCTSLLSTMFSNHHHITPDALTSVSQHLVKSVCRDSEPSSCEEVALNPIWQTTMTQ
uniref:GATA zinc finger domain-containing protein 14-like n=1 Tax=Nicotiana sylvestris TaxID=4096 RepID=A0A1U7XRV3_NICSY|nr:PREDICTED: GATA zinc finger domain-containing protein 14-like [Nicotiana sylvestris]